MEHADGKLLAEVDGGIGTITLNQPEKRNAMSVAMWTALEQILRAWSDDPAVRVVILAGAGDKAFASGADISEFEKYRGNAEATREYDRLTGGGRAALSAFRKPIIARIHGYCLGGGLGIAMEADLRIASPAAVFGIPAARLGIAYGTEATRKLIALVGHSHARLILYSAARLDAAEALRIGLVNRIVPSERLVEEVQDLARTIATNAPLSVHAAKLIIGELQKDPAERDGKAIGSAVAACFDSADYAEGRAAFREKRQPRFAGR
jgi:enoyl-CoA hydratase